MKTNRFLNMHHHGFPFLLALAFSFFVSTALAQDTNKREERKMQQGLLKEAKVTARVLTTVEEVGPMRVRLNVLNPTKKPVRISILNYQNQPVFQESFREKEYNKVLNFNSTPAGRYSLHVAGRNNSEVRRFEVENKEGRDLTASPLNRSGNSDVMATIYKSSPTKVMLQMVNNTGKPVEYVFRNSAQEVIHQGYAKDKQFAQSFDMSQVTDGKYTVEVKYMTDEAASRTFDLNTVYERGFTWTDKRGKPLKPDVLATPAPNAESPKK
ncbi:MAG: hypothetical protein ACO1O1_01590 [Adhaeribacter sp.]